MDGLGKGFFRAPVTVDDSVEQGVIAHMNFPSPHTDRLCFAIKGEQTSDLPVVALLFRRRPSTIIRLVMAVVVNAFNRHAIRPFAHVSKKILKGSAPSFADANAARAISSIVLIPLVIASSLQAVPTDVRRIVGHTVADAGTAAISPGLLRSTQIVAFNRLVSAAVALAQPDGVAALHPNESQNDQSPETLALKIDKTRMGGFGKNDSAKIFVGHFDLRNRLICSLGLPASQARVSPSLLYPTSAHFRSEYA